MADPIAAVTAAIGAALLALQLKNETKDDAKSPREQGAASRALPGGEMTPAAPTIIPVFMPQDRPGPADSGGPEIIYALPPGATPDFLADILASKGQAHDAGTVINIYQTGEPKPPGTPPPPGGDDTSSTSSPPTTPPPPDTSPLPLTPEPEPEETHEDIWGNKQQGPPPASEVAAKAALGYGGGALLELAGDAKTTLDLATKGRAGLGGPVMWGLGAGLQVTQVLQDVGFFDDAVTPAGAATSEALGDTGSKAAATVALPLSLPGAVIKAAVTPGESVWGNLQTAAEKSFAPEIRAGIETGFGKLQDIAGKAKNAITSPLSFFGNPAKSLAEEFPKLAGDVGHAWNQGVGGAGQGWNQTAGDLGQKATNIMGGPNVVTETLSAAGQKFNEGAGDLGHKWNQGTGAAGQTWNDTTGYVGSLFTRKWF